ncbi:peptide synthase [Planctopirus ephydatiae]|uniref:Peptide synthase n=1 Tax=Planctopirus ephydatiae TaxID=2528019 RepID=A0A518GTH5_9PLAN|nr:condensation domain-containing protein [Planctopirus ephydatiae]QDV31882.1 peptide synthase [Planctopirus ephydatiae]
MKSSALPTTAPGKLSDSEMLKVRQLDLLKRIPKRFPATFADMSQFMVRQANTQHGNLIVRFDRHIDSSRLEQAMRLVIYAEPILGCRFVEHWYRPYWQRRDDVDCMALCIVMNVENPESALTEFMEAEIDPSKDPLIQVSVFRSKCQDTLCYKMNHLVGDAPSLLKIVLLIGEYYQKLSVEPSFLPEPNLRSRDHSEVLKHFSLSEKIRVARSFLANQRLTRNLWLLDVNDVGVDRVKGRYFIRKLDRSISDSIWRFSKQHRATVTVILLAAVYKTMRRMFPATGDDGLGVGTTVDHRNYLPAREREVSPVANLSGPSRMFVDLPADASLGEVVEVIKEQFKEALKSRLLGLNYPAVFLSMPFVRPLLLMVPFGVLQSILKRVAGPRLFGRTRAVGIANVGNLAAVLDVFGDVKPIDAFATAAIFRTAGIGFVVTQFKGTTTIAIGATESLVRADVCEMILDGIEEELLSLNCEELSAMDARGNGGFEKV